MATDLYDLTVPAFIRGLRNLSALLDKGAAYAAEKGIDPLTLTQARLIEDMAPSPPKCNMPAMAPRAR